MKGFLLLADAARTHPDATFSVLRGGITEVTNPRGRPSAFRGTMVIRISMEKAEHGNHTFKLTCMDEDGAMVLPEIGGQFTTKPASVGVNLTFDIHTVFPKPGLYDFNLLVDGVLLDTWQLTAKEGEPRKPKPKK